MWTIQKRPASDGDWTLIYSDWSQAKVRRQFLPYKTVMNPGQALRLMHGDAGAEESAAQPTRLTPI